MSGKKPATKTQENQSSRRILKSGHQGTDIYDLAEKNDNIYLGSFFPFPAPGFAFLFGIFHLLYFFKCNLHTRRLNGHTARQITHCPSRVEQFRRIGF